MVLPVVLINLSEDFWDCFNGQDTSATETLVSQAACVGSVGLGQAAGYQPRGLLSCCWTAQWGGKQILSVKGLQ